MCKRKILDKGEKDASNGKNLEGKEIEASVEEISVLVCFFWGERRRKRRIYIFARNLLSRTFNFKGCIKW